ncbi:MAG: glutamine synthetase family protein [Candidatus Thermoplasmatota archaeon]|nr:glutamine synthetase family protein [Candidatus Thermoplasmatota archaeon]
MEKNELKKIIKDENITWIQLHFTDLFGGLRVFHIPSKQFLEDDVLTYGLGFDGSSVGLKHVEKSDMIVIPDSETFLVLPHEKNEARIFADVYETDKKASVVDPRYILKEAVRTIQEQGFEDVIISPEMEFFILTDHEKKHYEPLASQGYCAPPPLDDVKEFRKTISELLLKSNINVKYHHHESGRYQHEIEIKPLSAITAADFSMYIKYLSRDIASVNNLQVTFIPKLFADEAGNGMHVHIKLLKNGKNAFIDKNNKYNLSETARYFIGGILHHAKSIAAFANPTVNSYKRLIPHFEAPLYIAWDRHNRSSLIRIAAKENVDIEVRNGDPSANPYLFFAALIHAGLDGMRNKYEYEPVEQNIYEMSENELRTLHIEKLPSTLIEALQELEQDTFFKKAMGEELINLYVERKRKELNDYLSEVSDVDLKYYMHC